MKSAPVSSLALGTRLSSRAEKNVGPRELSVAAVVTKSLPPTFSRIIACQEEKKKKKKKRSQDREALWGGKRQISIHLYTYIHTYRHVHIYYIHILCMCTYVRVDI
jgi:hypothetical protein